MNVFKIKYLVGGYHSEQNLREWLEDEIRIYLDETCEFPDYHPLNDSSNGYSEIPVICKLVSDINETDMLREIYIWTGRAIARFEINQGNLGVAEINVNGISYDVPEAYYIKPLVEI